MTDENRDIEQDEKQEIEDQKPETFNNDPYKTTAIVIVSFLISLAVAFVLYNSPIFSYKKQSYYYLDDSHSCILMKPNYHEIQKRLENAAAIYVNQQGVKPKRFSDFVVSRGSTTDLKTASLTEFYGDSEGISTKKLYISRIGTYHLNDIIKDEVLVVAKDRLEKQRQLEEENNKENIYNIIKPFGALSFLVIFNIVIFFIISSIRLIKTLDIVMIFIIIILACISILTALGGQINETVSTITKPAIYLYPKTPTKVAITLDESIKLTLDVPRYAPNKGWYVLAQPNGQIVDLQPQYTDCNKLDPTQFGMEYAKEACLNNNYPYVYWEGDVLKNNIPHQTKGWLVKTANVKEFLTLKLDYVGFNKQEKSEFIRYWVHKIKELNKETVFISFMQTQEVEKYFPMTVTPTPESVNRFYIFIDPEIEKHQNPVPQTLIKFKRKGFTLVDWGGCVTTHDHIKG